MGLEAIQDVAPRILDTYRLEVAYGTEHVTDGNHLTKAQVAAVRSGGWRVFKQCKEIFGRQLVQM